MPPAANKVEDPCQECRGDDGRPKCKQCKRLGEECHRSKAKPKFRFGSSAKYDQTFSKDQIWLAQSKTAKFQFVDQGPELENYYSTDELEPSSQQQALSPQTQPQSDDEEPRATSSDTSSRTPIRQSNHGAESTVITPASISIEAIINPSPKRRRLDEPTPPVSDIRTLQSAVADQDPNRYYIVPEHSNQFGIRSSIGSPDVPEPVKKRVYAEYQRIEDSNAAYVPAEELLAPAIWKAHFVWPNHLTTTQCTCLMRYYIDHLGPWLDIGDPSRSFTLVVPQRARRCPPLLNAIFTVAARRLACIPKYRDTNGIVRYGRNVMPRMDAGQALKYHNASIAYLKELCNHPTHVQDEDLLAAIVILRYYEEFDTSLGGERAESMTRPFQLFVTAQAYSSISSHLAYGTLDFSIPGTYTSMRRQIEVHLKSFQHASFRIALRQECARALMKQQPIGLNLETWSMLEGFDEAEDFVWADRHLYHLARVLHFCFDNETRGQQHLTRWEALRKFEDLWEENKPFSFAAIHYKNPDRALGEILPEIWYLAEVHAFGIQCLNLSRILLAVYNPTLPRLGPGAALAQKRTSAKIRDAVIQLCGIAVSMQDCEPALIQACMAVALCGEHISDYLEQQTLIGLLTRLQDEHGLETTDTVQSLKESWSWG